ncbi:hypothetical protein ABIA32_001995 [Streptacidiphilus sp. MAP12-20]|uniref:PD-(D/E)XK motif protein n=1 Tax=Streptacidiphilus sp. MAP12-20 TaxID=3156299 RepID=UPI0035149DCA
MNDDELRRLVEDRWSALEAEATVGARRLRVAELPTEVVNGTLAVAVDREGHRHLLVPIHMHRKVRPGLDGPVLRLRKRSLEDAETFQTYADLACLRDDLNDLFTKMCVNVLGATSETPDNPVKVLYRVLDRWRALFRAQGTLLGPEELAGFYGELTVLKRFLQKDPSAHRFWQGPLGYRHDFAAGSEAVEVKSATSGDGRKPRIHGLDQLEAPVDGALVLAWFRLRRTTTEGLGAALNDTAEEVLRLCDDEGTVLELFARAGYRLSDADRYHDVRYEICEERWYRVEAGFPRLTGRALEAAGVPVSVLDVEYTIDLSGEVPAPLTAGEVAQVIDRMIQESV